VNTYGVPAREWIWRLGAALVVALLVPIMVGWLGRTDVFVEFCCKRQAYRAATFWPLVVLWVGTLGMFTFALLGTGKRWWVELRRPSALTVAWWLAALAWTTAAAIVFARNISGPVLWRSLLPVGKMTIALLVVVAIVALLLRFATRKTQRMRVEVAQDYAALSADERRDLLDSIEQHALTGEYEYLYRCVEGSAEPGALARIAGDPIARPGEAWPLEPDGASAWQDRVVVVFFADWTVEVRSYAPAQEPDLVTLPNPGKCAAPAGFRLRRMAVPYMPVNDDDDNSGDNGFEVARLPDLVPGLRARLERHSKHPGQLLARVLAERGDAHWSSVEEDVLVGGDPMLIQSEHDARCPICAQPMRFLFQFGDLNEEFLFGDAGVAYVYGCDAHPRECQGFVDCM
jgi:hypothetical protein